MLAILAAIAFGTGYILDASGAHTDAWLSPAALILLGLALLALHLATGWWPRRPQGPGA